MIKKKAEKATRLIKNRCDAALKNIPGLTSKPDILSWAEIEKSEFYQNELVSIYSLYEHNLEFRNDIRDATKQVIAAKDSETMDFEESINEGVHYTLKELAFFVAGTQMFNCENIVIIYYKEWSVLQNFLNGKYDGKVKSNIGYTIIS